MRILDRNGQEMFVRVQHFGVQQVADFPPTSLGGKTFAELDALIANLEQHASIQVANSGGSRVGTTTRATLRAVLKETLKAFHITALALEIDIPGLANQFRVPSGGDKALLNAARSFLKEATPLKARFIEHEMPPDFLEELTREIDEFEAAVAEQTRSKQARVKATASLESLMEQGLKIVQRLDAIVRNKYRNDRPMLSVWGSASHIERHNSRSTHPPKTAPTKPDASETPLTK